eukprot:GEMP01094670.1.p1 GENE.GEMP01094670.1~~GEMP01094670.1.p1  ORF type:complete len:124 (-),score=8.11 GEMP01094670.1:361-732(-)
MSIRIIRQGYGVFTNDAHDYDNHTIGNHSGRRPPPAEKIRAMTERFQMICELTPRTARRLGTKNVVDQKITMDFEATNMTTLEVLVEVLATPPNIKNHSGCSDTQPTKTERTKKRKILKENAT